MILSSNYITSTGMTVGGFVFAKKYVILKNRLILKYYRKDHKNPKDLKYPKDHTKNENFT